MNNQIFPIIVALWIVFGMIIVANHAYASETPEQHTCISDKMHKMMEGIIVGLSFDHSPAGIASIGDLVDNDTAFIESCLK